MKSQQNISNLDLIHLINQTDDRLSFVDTNYVYRVVNQAYVNAFNKSFDEIIGHTVWEMIGMDTFEHVIKPKLDLALSGKEIRYEAWFDFANGSRAYMVVCYRPSFDTEDNVIGVSVTSTDITEQKRLEEEKLLYEKKVFEQSRTAQLGEMIAFIAHQWRGSLHTLSTYLLRLRMEIQRCSTSDAEQLFNRCESLFEQLSNHIEDVYALYRQNDFSKEVDLEIALNQAVSILQPRLKAEKIHLLIDLPKMCILPFGNSQLVHVFIVLLENSVEALSQIEQKEKQIHIHARDNGENIIIDVSDNGDGVSSEIAQKLFNAGTSTKDSSDHGYGLYFAHQIITQQFGGVIELRPDTHGAHFQIRVPICTCEVNT